MVTVDRRTALRGALMGAGVAATGLASVGPAAAAPRVDGSSVDVAIVGAGLSGLAAAKKLRQHGRSVVVLEARDRPGGRVHNVQTAGGVTFDGGAEFIGPTQDEIAALAKQFGVRTLPTYNDGNNIFYDRGRATRYPSFLPIPPNIGAVEEIAALLQLDILAKDFPVGRPWTYRDARRLDAMTWQDWVDKHACTAPGKLLLSLVETSTLSVRPREVSALYMLNYIAAAGTQGQPGTVERLISVAGGAQEKFFDGGAALIPLRLAASMADSIRYSAPVRAIRATDGGYAVDSDAGSVTARKVIVAMSPAISGRIDYRPGLPDDRVGLTEGYRMGRIAKFVGVYRTPFWRARGLTGQVVGDGTPIDVTFESYSEGNHILLGFISADAMRELDPVPDDVFVERCTESLVRYFGPQARTEMIDNGFKKWDDDPWSRGGPVAVAGPGVLTRYRDALRRPVAGIHWAGTETSDFWTGYMDGAVRSGYRAAAEVDKLL